MDAKQGRSFPQRSSRHYGNALPIYRTLLRNVYRHRYRRRRGLKARDTNKAINLRTAQGDRVQPRYHSRLSHEPSTGYIYRAFECTIMFTLSIRDMRGIYASNKHIRCERCSSLKTETHTVTSKHSGLLHVTSGRKNKIHPHDWIC